MEYWLFGTGVLIVIWTWFMVRRGYLAGWERLEASRRQLEDQVAELTIVAEDVLADVRERTEKLEQLLQQADQLLNQAERPADGTAVAEATRPAEAAASARQPVAETTIPAVQPAPTTRDRAQVNGQPPQPRPAVAPVPPTVLPPAADAQAAGDSEPPAVLLLSALEAVRARMQQESERPAQQSSPAPRHRQVWELAEQGLAPADIARRLQTTQGEVELILGLRKLG